MFRMIYVIKLSTAGAFYGELVGMNYVLTAGKRKSNFTCLIVFNVVELGLNHQARKYGFLSLEVDWNDYLELSL